jgi:hypothetical protein
MFLKYNQAYKYSLKDEFNQLEFVNCSRISKSSFFSELYRPKWNIFIGLCQFIICNLFLSSLQFFSAIKLARIQESTKTSLIFSLESDDEHIGVGRSRPNRRAWRVLPTL